MLLKELSIYSYIVLLELLINSKEVTSCESFAKVVCKDESTYEVELQIFCETVKTGLVLKCPENYFCHESEEPCQLKQETTTPETTTPETTTPETTTPETTTPETTTIEITTTEPTDIEVTTTEPTTLEVTTTEPTTMKETTTDTATTYISTSEASEPTTFTYTTKITDAETTTVEPTTTTMKTTTPPLPTGPPKCKEKGYHRAFVCNQYFECYKGWFGYTYRIKICPTGTYFSVINPPCSSPNEAVCTSNKSILRPENYMFVYY